MANRWVLSQFMPKGSNTLCFAVSQTPDPLGSYFLYAFATPDFPDYFKVGVWPDGYYVSSNESTYTAYALDRAADARRAPRHCRPGSRPDQHAAAGGR